MEQINVNEIIAKINVPDNLKPTYESCITSGMRIMFGKDTHGQMLDLMKRQAPMEKNICDGVVALIYLMWQHTNKNLPPQVIAPVTMALVLKAYDFLQKSGDPSATPQMLSNALTLTITTVLAKFGLDVNKLGQVAATQGAK